MSCPTFSGTYRAMKKSHIANAGARTLIMKKLSATVFGAATSTLATTPNRGSALLVFLPRSTGRTFQSSATEAGAARLRCPMTRVWERLYLGSLADAEQLEDGKLLP